MARVGNIQINRNYSGDGTAWYGRYIGTTFTDCTCEVLTDGRDTNTMWTVPNDQIGKRDDGIDWRVLDADCTEV